VVVKQEVRSDPSRQLRRNSMPKKGKRGQWHKSRKHSNKYENGGKLSGHWVPPEFVSNPWYNLEVFVEYRDTLASRLTLIHLRDLVAAQLGVSFTDVYPEFRLQRVRGWAGGRVAQTQALGTQLEIVPGNPDVIARTTSAASSVRGWFQEVRGVSGYVTPAYVSYMWPEQVRSQALGCPPGLVSTETPVIFEWSLRFNESVVTQVAVASFLVRVLWRTTTAQVSRTSPIQNAPIFGLRGIVENDSSTEEELQE